MKGYRERKKQDKKLKDYALKKKKDREEKRRSV
jgi:hypothetical protein